MSEAPGLALTLERSEGVDVLRLSGELDMANADELARAIEATSAPHVVLDLEGLAYLDSAGIRAIDRAHRQLATGGRTLAVVASPDSRAGWTFRVAGFGEGLVVASLEAGMGGDPSAGER
jgi:anti-sigma B factor antagonist